MDDGYYCMKSHFFKKTIQSSVVGRSSDGSMPLMHKALGLIPSTT